MAGQSDTLQQQDTLNRYLLYFPRSKTVSPDVHSFCGEEELSKPYRYTIRFTSPNPNVAVKDVLNQMAEFILRAPDPKAKSTWHNQESWLPVRQINGVITSFSRLKSSADEALYECMLEHELALLDQNYRSAVYSSCFSDGVRSGVFYRVSRHEALHGNEAADCRPAGIQACQLRQGEHYPCRLVGTHSTKGNKGTGIENAET